MEIGKKFQTFDNRIEAARLLVTLLKDLKHQRPLILAIPRGAVPMAKIIWEELGGDLDLALVRKIPHPYQPEYAIGSVSESGDIIMDRSDGLTPEEMEEAAWQEIRHLQSRRHLYLGHNKPISAHDRTVIVVDDGIATGSTMAAAVRSLKAQGASRIIVAAPVASASAVRRLEAEGAEVRVYLVPEYFGAVSYFYNNFDQISDSEVGEFFRVRSVHVEIPTEHQKYRAILGIPVAPRGVVLFAQASDRAHLSPRNQFLAETLNRQGLATVLVDLFTEEEALDPAYSRDIKTLSERLLHWTAWIDERVEFRHLPLGYLGTGVGAAAAVRALTLAGERVSAFVSRGGRLDLAEDFLTQVQVPALLLVGSEDHPIIELNQQALRKMNGEKRLEIIQGASHLFEEPGTLDQVAFLTANWFHRCFAQAQITHMDVEPPVYP